MSVVNEIWNPYKVYKQNESVLFTAIVYTVKVGQVSTLGVPPPVDGSVIWTGASGGGGGGGGGGASGATISSGNGLITVSGTPANTTINATPITTISTLTSTYVTPTTSAQVIGSFVYTPKTNSSSIAILSNITTSYRVIGAITDPVLQSQFSYIISIVSNVSGVIATVYYPFTTNQSQNFLANNRSICGFDFSESLDPITYTITAQVDVVPVSVGAAIFISSAVCAANLTFVCQTIPLIVAPPL